MTLRRPRQRAFSPGETLLDIQLDAARVAPREEVFFMLDELLDVFDGGDDDDDRGRRRNRAPRQGGIRGFISRLFGMDDGDDPPPDDGRYSRRRERALGDDDDDDDGYERAGRRNRRRDRDDDGWLDFGD
jgi:hypothetical protein